MLSEPSSLELQFAVFKILNLAYAEWRNQTLFKSTVIMIMLTVLWRLWCDMQCYRQLSSWCVLCRSCLSCPWKFTVGYKQFIRNTKTLSHFRWVQPVIQCAVLISCYCLNSMNRQWICAIFKIHILTNILLLKFAALICMFSLQGRPYLDKMQSDRTEMLYWLQEERKVRVINAKTHRRLLPPLPSLTNI